MVDTGKLADLVRQIPPSEYAKHPNLSQDAVRQAVADFVSELP